MNADIEVIGNGNIGDKARQLIQKSPALRKIGFHTPKRTVLAEDYFDGFFQRNRLGDNLQGISVIDGIEDRIKHGSLTLDEFNTLVRVCDSYEDQPLAVRSSAEGDSRGTGTYKSTFTDSRVTSVRKSILKVIGSYFSNDAIAFRRDANTGEGFAVILEPIIGQRIEQEFSDNIFAPILSGFGYTSTSRGEGHVVMVPGLGGGVESRDGERITREIMQQFKGSLDEYLDSEKDAMFSYFREKVKRKSKLLKTDRESLSFDRGFTLDAYFAPSRHEKRGRVYPTSVEFTGELDRTFRELNLLPFFEMMKKMEDSFGKPQYFEWAMTLDNGQPKYWITQVADVNKKLDLMDFEDLGEVLFSAHTVTGTGIKESNKIANCWNPDDVARLYEFNKRNENYVLLFSSRMTSRGVGVRRLSYSDFSNARVFLEIQDAQHTGDPVAHLGGQLDMTGKLFGVLEYGGEIPPNWERFESKEQEEDGLRVYQGKVKTIASERQNRMVVSALD
jgi:hypothetical protein